MQRRLHSWLGVPKSMFHVYEYSLFDPEQWSAREIFVRDDGCPELTPCERIKKCVFSPLTVSYCTISGMHICMPCFSLRWQNYLRITAPCLISSHYRTFLFIYWFDFKFKLYSVSIRLRNRNGYCSDSEFWQVTVPVPVPALVPAPYLDNKQQVKQKFPRPLLS